MLYALFLIANRLYFIVKISKKSSKRTKDNLIGLILLLFKDSASTINQSLYTGVCMENAYFQALSHIRNSTGSAGDYVFNQLDLSLHAELAIKIAEQTREKANLSGLEQYLTTPNEEAAFVKTFCVGLSNSHDNLLDNLNVDKTEAQVKQALDECKITRQSNQDFLDNYLDDITEFFCQAGDCVSVQSNI